MRSKIIIIIVSVVTIPSGILIGVFIKNYPFLTLKTEIGIVEGLSFFLTLGLAVLVPFMVKRWIDDDRFVKIYLIQELEELISLLKKDIVTIESCYKAKQVTSEDKDDINFNTYLVDLKIESFIEQFNIAYPRNSKTVEDIKNKNLVYYHFLTGGDFMNSSFVIDLKFFKQFRAENNKAISGIKVIIQSIQKL